MDLGINRKSLFLYIRRKHPFEEIVEQYESSLGLERWNHVPSGPHSNKCEASCILLNIASHL